MNNEEKKNVIAGHIQGILEALGLDTNHPSIKKTPNRVAKMYVDEVFSGLDPKNFPKTNLVDDVHTDSGMVFVTSSFVSFCEHHLVPMAGTCAVAYLPNKKLIGLSKIPRIVRFYARRPQLQERLTSQISSKLGEILNTEHIGVSITATHFCVLARGIEDPHSETTTNLFKGKFRSDLSLKNEFFHALHKK